MRQKRKNKKALPAPEEEKTLTPEEQAALPKQALLAHVKALRNMLIISVTSIGVAFVVVFLAVSPRLIAFLKAPLNVRGIDLIYLSLAESMGTQMKISLIAGCILASPIVFWQIWSFVKPALYPREGRTFIGMFIMTVFLFILGAVFAYLVVFQMAINFFLTNAEGMASPFISIEKYVSFLVGFILPFGLAFELPIVLSLLTRSGLVTVAMLTKARKYIIFAIFVIAAILTPPDVVSQILLAIPLVILFEAGVLVSRITQKRAAKRKAAAENS